jgi:hypothetical protein
VQLAVLGPLEVHTDSGALLEVGGARLGALLILALDPGRVVSTARPIRSRFCRPGDLLREAGIR